MEHPIHAMSALVFILSAVGCSDSTDPNPAVGPELSVGVSSLHFATNQNTSTFTIENAGTGSLEWTVSEDADWLSTDPGSGETTHETVEVVATVDRAGQAVGPHACSLTVSSNGGTETIDVTMDASPLDWIATCDQPWLSVIPDSGDITCEDESESVTIVVDKSGFNRGTVYWGTVTISSNGGYAQVRVRCVDPIVGVSPASLDFGEEETVLPLTIFNEGAGPLDDDYFAWEVRSSESWLTASMTTGTLDSDNRDEEIEIHVSRTGLEPGTYTGELTALGLCSSQDEVESKTVAVSMEVPVSQSGATLVMGLSHSGQDPYDLNDVLTIQLDLQIDGEGIITGSGTGTHTGSSCATSITAHRSPTASVRR